MMNQFLLCATVVCAASVSLAQTPADKADKAEPTAKANALDGTWTVVSIEKNGEPMKDAKDRTVTVKDNTVTCSGKDGKPAMTVKFEFTGPGMAKVMMTDGSATGTSTGTDRKEPAATDKKDDTKADAKAGTKAAVYVLTSEYLAVCIHDDKANNTGTGGTGTGTGGTGTGTGTGGTGAITTSDPSTKTYCSIVLKRGEKK